MIDQLLASNGQGPARGTIYVEDAVILSHQSLAAEQYLLRLQAPQTAATARPGNFIHLSCHPQLPMRRPMSIMRCSPDQGWLDILYKAHGHGTRLLARRGQGETLNLLGPIGVPFRLAGYRKRPLLIGGGVGIPPMVFLAEYLKHSSPSLIPLAIMGSEVPFPFHARPSQIMVSAIPEGIIAGMPLLDDWGIASRLCSLQGYAGCYQGYVTDLARYWLDHLPGEARDEVEIFSCGPTPMLQAVAALAREYGLPCQVSVEEYMACGVGGCAGCSIRVETETGPAMKRVCVDGPVFEASSVFP